MSNRYPWCDTIRMPIDPKEWPAWDAARAARLRNLHEPDETQEYWLRRHEAHEAIRAAIHAPLPKPMMGHKV